MKLESSRVLVTGADGFIGSHLVEQLVRRSAHVRALSFYNSFNNWGWLEGLPRLSDIEVVTGDIRDPHFCYRLTENIDIVLHLAALIAIPFSYQAPGSFVQTNVQGTLNICQAALAAGVKRLVQVSTSEVYGTARYVPIDESHPLQAQSPYSATKIGADAIVVSFVRSFALPAVIARPFNTYGPRQSARAVIPTIISQIGAGNTSIELGELDSTRDFTYVEDTVGGMMALAEMEGGIGEVFNIGSNSEIRIGELARLIGETMGRPITISVAEGRKRPPDSEVMRLWCNNEKLAAATGFRSSVTFQEGLKRTIDWFRDPDNLRRYKIIYNV